MMLGACARRSTREAFPSGLPPIALPAVSGSGDGNAGLEERVRILYRIALEGLLLVDDARRYVNVNEPAAALLGAPPEALIGRRMEQYTPRDSLPLLERGWTALERAGQLEGRGRLMRADGSERMVEYRARWGFAPGRHLVALREVRPPALPLVTADDQAVPRLTPREREVLQLAADGRSTRDIAGLLIVSPGTVKTHLQHIYAKLDARDRASAVATAMRLGLIS
jgi:PAS domain S-box-containing protein